MPQISYTSAVYSQISKLITIVRGRKTLSSDVIRIICISEISKGKKHRFEIVVSDCSQRGGKSLERPKYNSKSIYKACKQTKRLSWTKLTTWNSYGVTGEVKTTC